MLIVQPSILNSITFVSIIHMLYIFSAYCPVLAVTLLKMNIAETLMCLLMGSTEGRTAIKTIPITYKSAALSTTEVTASSIQPTSPIELISRTPQELYEIVSLIGEMMPRLPTDEPLFQVDQLFRRSTLTHRAYEVSSNGYVLWHWQDDQGQLRPYSPQDSRTIEHAWQQHEEEVQLMITGRHYLIDLQQLQQINEETNQARFIKRILTPESNESTTASTDSNDESIARPPTTTNTSLDARTDMMKDNLDLYNTFIQSLFTVLYEVYNSSAGPAVKHRCLQALLRMIFYSSSDLLEIILKQQSISSHIASMLASSDYKIVISALQMAEILMKKLPQIFSVYFYREGVVHQIEILINFGILSSTSSATASSSNLSLARTVNTSASRSQLELTHLADESPSPVDPLDEQQLQSGPRPHSRRYYTTSESYPASTRIETRSQRARLPHSSRLKPSTRSMFDEMTSRPIVGRGTGASFSTGTLDTNLGRARPSRGTPVPPVMFRPTSTFDPSAYYPRPPVYVPSPYAYASSAPTAASFMMSTHYQQQQSSQMVLSSHEKTKLKEWIQNQARHFRSTYFTNNPSTSNIALQIIHRLAAAVDILHVGKDTLENTKALRDIANIIAKGDVSPFEMVHSGLITKLFQYLTDDLSIPNDRPERLKRFLNIFINIPVAADQQQEGVVDDENALRQYIVELHHTQFHHGKGTPRAEHHVLSHLINKLHGCINQLEQFPIRGIDICTHENDLHRIFSSE